MFVLIRFPVFSSSALINSCSLTAVSSKDTHPCTPVIGSGVHDDLVRKRVRFGDCDRRDVIFVAVYDVDYLEACFLKRLLHSGSDFDSVWSS